MVCVKELVHNDDISNELSILSKCIHPKIVQFLGADTSADKTSMVFEYMEEGTLSDYIKSHKLSKIDKFVLMIDILIGINYLHKREPNIILHRDLKPDNILVNKYGQVKIADFGISKLVEFEKCNDFSGHTCETGTYMWMSPEVLKHEPYNYKADMYSLGLILYYIWTEEEPFIKLHMNTIQLAFAKFKNELEYNKTNNDQLNNIIRRCCAYDKEIRPDSAMVIKELNQLLLAEDSDQFTIKQVR